jgi:hypothetical protein
MRHAFSDGAIEAILRPIMAPEEFTAGHEPPGAHHSPDRATGKPSPR